MVDHRVELLQRTLLPLHDGVADRVGDVADRPGRQLHPEGGLQVVADLAHRHTPGVQADDHRVQAVHAPLALAHQAGREGAGTVPGDLDLEGADLGVHRLGRRPVSGVAPRRRGPLALVVAQVVGQFSLQTTLQGLLQQCGQQPVRAGQGHLP